MMLIIQHQYDDWAYELIAYTRVDYAPYDIGISAFGISDVLEPNFRRERVIIKPLQELHFPTTERGG
jgi:hypothetical protein